ncbi:AAA family ATPase [Mesorhizobium sp. 10J20-29]
MNSIESPREAQQFGDVIASSIAQSLSSFNTSVPPKQRLSGGAVASAFLHELDPTGWHNLVALDPTQDIAPPVAAQTFAPGEFDAMAKWIDERDGELNLYYSVNEPRPRSPHKKLAAGDIGAIRAVVADIDLPALAQGADAEKEVAHYVKLMGAVAEQTSAPPTVLIDSGGGVQLVWKLDRGYDPKESRTWAEEQGRAIANAFGGDKVQDIARIMRLPGPENIPTPKKVKMGRVRRRAAVVASHVERGYSDAALASAFTPVAASEALGAAPADVAAAHEAIDMGEVEAHETYGDLPSDLRLRFEAAIDRVPKLAALWNGDTTALLGSDQTSSAWRAALAGRLSSNEGFDAQDYASLVWVWEQADRAKIDHRQLARDWAKYGEPNVARRAAVLAHFVPVAETALPPTQWIDPTAWLGQTIKPREWEVEGWIPRHEVTLLYGDGGIGKTLLAHQYATAAATGRSWLGQNTRPARVMCFFCEDSAAELHRRQADINALLHVDYPDLANLRLASRKQDDNALGVWDRSAGRLKLTPAWDQLKADAIEFGADVIVIDTLSDVFVGDEISRNQVNAFVKGCLGRLGAAIGGSVIALGHPSVSGKASGSGTSGSTAWNNAVRSRLYLRYPKGTDKGNIRELEGMKLNYGPKGSLLKIRWERGAFATIAGNTTAAANANTGWPAYLIPQLDDVAEAATIKALNECSDVALSMSRNSVHFAPKILARRSPELLQGYSAEEIQGAMERLERKKLIRNAVVGRTSSRHPINGFVVVVPDNLSVAASATASVFE